MLLSVNLGDLVASLRLSSKHIHGDMLMNVQYFKHAFIFILHMVWLSEMLWVIDLPRRLWRWVQSLPSQSAN